MRLKNKKTGEIVENAYIRESHDFYNKRTIAVFVRDGNRPPERVSTGYETLAELNEEWEDYEDEDVEEEFWYVDTDCETYGVSRAFNQNNSDDILFNKSIGNYFETKEETEKAVEKLKAWKRLKDKGFRFTEWYKPDGCEPFITVETNINYDDVDNEELQNDLDLLFGGEE